MKFLWTTIYVKNMDESIAFYSDLLELKVINRFQPMPGIEITFMGNGESGETLVELLADNSKTDIKHTDSIVIGFAVNSVNEMIEVVKKKNIPIYVGPIKTPTSVFFDIKDPNGLSIQFFEQK